MSKKKIAKKFAKIVVKEAGEHLLTSTAVSLVPVAPSYISAKYGYKSAKYVFKGLKKLF